MRILRTALLILLAASSALYAAPPPRRPPVGVVFLSDIHFNPYTDPATVAQLIAQPASAWDAILAAAPTSPALTAAQKQCASQPDTQYTLLHSSFEAMRPAASRARFVTVSGDLLGHNFLACYEAFALPETQTPAYQFNRPIPLNAAQQTSYSDFVGKTLAFLTSHVAAIFPRRPIYYALGNNDTDCDDYLLDPGSDFLRRTAVLFTRTLPAAQRTPVRRSFAADGDYSLRLLALPNTRLIVLDDLYLSQGYGPCTVTQGSAQHPPSDPAAAEIAWLKAQLRQAQLHHQRVWVMGHIPPGLNLYETVKTGHPVTFLKPDHDFAPILTASPGLVRLGIFAHTHIDSMGELDGATPVPLKIVQSISPDHGNPPSFTLARINPATSRLIDYTIIPAKLTDRNARPAAYAWPAPADWPTHPTWSYTPSTPKP
jgi:sphingomyelin phosphodiesterase acid-like 3